MHTRLKFLSALTIFCLLAGLGAEAREKTEYSQG